MAKSVITNRLAVLALAFVTGGLYVAAMGHSFIGMDYPAYSRVLYSSTYLTTTYQLLLDIKGTIVSGYYAPLSSISLMLDKALAGYDLPNARITLFINILLHCCNGLLVFILLTRLGVTSSVAIIACGLFLLHPIQVPSILWFSQRKTLMAAMFYLISYVFYDRYRENGSLPHYYGALLMFGCALLSKPTAVVLPVILLADEILRLMGIRAKGKRLVGFTTNHLAAIRDSCSSVGSGHSTGDASMPVQIAALRKRFVPFFVLSLIYGIITIGTEIPPKVNLPIYERPFLASVSLIFYIWNIVIPVDLMYVYPKWNIVPSHFSSWLPLLAVIIGVSAIYFLRRRVAYEVWWGLAGFLVPLVPVLGFVKFGYFQHSFVADHFLYLSMIGATVCIAVAIGYAFEKAGPRLKYGVAAAVLIYAVALIYQTNTRIAVWKNDLSLWGHNAEACPSCYTAQDMLGLALLGAGRSAEAAQVLSRAVKKWPDKCEAYHNLGAVETKLGKVEDAMAAYRKAITVCPDSYESHNNLGDLLSRQGKNPEAIEHYRTAIRISPYFSEAYSNLGDEMLKLGRTAEALANFRTALRLKPHLPEANHNLGWIEMQSGRIGEALMYFRTAVRFKPDFAEAYNSIGIAQASLGRMAEAAEAFKKAVIMKPDFDDARKNLARALGQSGNVSPGNQER